MLYWLRLMLALPAAVCAQQFTDLSGVVLDPSGAGVSAAEIAVVNEDTGFRRNTSTRAGGAYLIASLHPGSYKVTVRKEGFRTTIRFGVKLDVSSAARVDFSLVIGSVHESITVESAPPLINADDGAAGTLIGRERIEKLPLNGRGLMSLMELASGTVVTPATRGEAGQFTTNGQRPNTNYFTVDGVSANNGVSGGGLPMQSTGGSLPGMTAFGTLHSLATLEAVDEFRVQTSSAMTEFGRLPGAQVSISSRSGSNDFHGSLFHYFRHERLDANDWHANRYGYRRVPLRVNDFGVTLGGPVRHDKTFFFAAYEGIRLRQPFAWRGVVPSQTVLEESPVWVRNLVNLFPRPNGAGFGNGLSEWTGRGSRPSRLDAGSARIDHALTSSITLFGRFSQAPSISQFGSTPVGELSLGSRSLTGGVNVRLPAGMVLDARGNHSRATGESLWVQPGAPPRPSCDPEAVTPSLLRDPTVCDHLIRVTIPGVGQASSGREGDWRQEQTYGSGALNLTLRNHHLRLGFEYLQLAPRYHNATGSYFLVAERVADLVQSENLWTGFTNPRSGSSLFRNNSVYVQDVWRVTQRLTASFGARWEFGPGSTGGQPAFYLDPETGQAQTVQRPQWPPRHSNLAPRAGIAFRLRRNGQTVIRAGGGLFFDSNVAVAADLVNSGPLNADQLGSGRFAPFSVGLLSYGFLPQFLVPEIRQWNAALEHGFGTKAVASIGYAGSRGRDLVRREIGGLGTTEVARFALATNHGLSNYHALQIQGRTRQSAGIQLLASYSWSHSIDNSSTDALLHWAGKGFLPSGDKGPSDFDARHAFSAAFTYDVRRGGRLAKGWSVDGILRARAGFPIEVLDVEHAMGLNFANAFRPDRVGQLPVWIRDASTPGGRRLNPAAFLDVANSRQGTLGRNAIRGFGAHQVDLALRRDFRLERRMSLQFRLEAFNAFNHPNFADPVRFLSSPLFGSSVSMLNLMLGTGSPGSGLAPLFQSGGPRSIQTSIRLRF
ncbi:MAG: carboxypeptidase-like regulatory domain-containing protein [Bryobacteraceae bacterium]|nr:carboxypeptidase-like regulatory domain-containing protein [Bryobacteraceae bacterium]